MCEHIPSRREINLLYDEFVNSKYMKEKSEFTHKETDVTFIATFPSTEIGMEFLKFLNLKKMQNRIEKMKVSIFMVNAVPTRKKLNPIKKKVGKSKSKSKSKSRQNSPSPNKDYIKTKDSTHFLKENLKGSSKEKYMSQSKSPYGDIIGKIKGKNNFLEAIKSKSRFLLVLLIYARK